MKSFSSSQDTIQEMNRPDTMFVMVPMFPVKTTGIAEAWLFKGMVALLCLILPYLVGLLETLQTQASKCSASKLHYRGQEECLNEPQKPASLQELQLTIICCCWTDYKVCDDLAIENC